jgi:hypothetical protein
MRRDTHGIVRDIVISTIGPTVYIADRYTRTEPQLTAEEADLMADTLRDAAAKARANGKGKK